MARKNPPGSIPDDTTLTEDDYKLLDRYYAEISLALDNYATTYNIPDWKKCKPLEWRGFCLYVGKNVFTDKTLLKEKVHYNGSCTVTNNNAYSIPFLSALYDMYNSLCYSVPGLPCRAYDFAAFVGVHFTTIASLQGRVSPAGAELLQNMAKEQENSMAMAGEGGRINVTMALAWNNHFHGWTQAREVIHRTDNRLMDSGSWKSRFLTEKSNGDSIESGENLPVLPVNVEE